MGSMSMRAPVVLTAEQQAAAMALHQQASSNQAVARRLHSLSTAQLPKPTDDRLDKALGTIEKLTDALAKATGVEVDA